MVVLNSSKGYSYNTATGVKTDPTGKTTTQARNTDSTYAPLSPNSIKKRLAMGITNMDPNKGTRALLREGLGTAPTPEPTNATESQAAPVAPQAEPGQTPSTVSQTGTVPYEQALKGLQSSGQSPQEIAAATNILKQKYQGGLAQTTSSGLQAPPTQGLANTQIQNTAPITTAPPSPLTSIVETDNTFDSIFTAFDDFFSPPKQKESLLQEYQGLEKSLGINKMNKELLNAKRIIEGTEDDIRDEVTAAGGFATDSQVQALANARNKSLIKNYNYLLESRDSAMTQLNTMMNLSIQDRQMAEQEFDRKMNFGFKVMEFKQRAIDNVRSQNSALLNTYGAQGVLSMLGGNAYETALFEKSMGMPQGGLARAAAYTPPISEEERLNIDLKKSQLATEALQRKNIQSQITERENPISTKPPTQAQFQVAGYRDRLTESNSVIDKLGNQFTSAASYLEGITPNSLKSSDRQLYEQAQRNFINAVLRRESGASISPDEFENARSQYFPQAGDKPAVIQQKAQNRETVINSFTRESSNVVGANVVTGPDGNEYEIVD